MDNSVLFLSIGAGIGIVGLSIAMLAFDDDSGSGSGTRELTIKGDSAEYKNVAVMFAADIGNVGETLFSGRVDRVCVLVNDAPANMNDLQPGSTKCPGACDAIMKKAAATREDDKIRKQAIDAAKDNSEKVPIAGVIVTEGFGQNINKLFHVVSPTYDTTTKNEELQIKELSRSYANVFRQASALAKPVVAIPLLGVSRGFPYEKSTILAVHHAFANPAIETYIYVADKGVAKLVRDYFLARARLADKKLSGKALIDSYRSGQWAVHFTKAMLECVAASS